MKEYEIALAYTRKDTKYPVGIKYLPGSEKPIHIWEGYNWSLNGVLLSFDEALNPQWKDHFKEADAEWFIKFIKELAIGNNIQIESINTEYRKQNNRELPIFEFKT
ncbi:MAG: hypothetical protein GY787_04170 [Alteromonadales bacterium]|nr:hypothetical protein [Alteromonadales bacterium]